jgi:hypothetical protein
MFRKAFVASWALCVFLLPQTASADSNNVVLYATDAVSLHGNWTQAADATAAGGQALVSADKGWSNTTAAAAAPADYVDFTFSAPSATRYHVWMRLRAAANSKYNDSLYAQFSDAIDASGAALYGLGTTNGLVFNLAADATGAGLSGWGWQDGAYWLTQATTIAFANDGSHTLRIQTREDGLSVDQIVLSPVTYLTAAPGGLSNDATIVAKSGSASTSTLPSPWSSQDVGATGRAGSASFANGVFTVNGAGADIWGAADAFRFLLSPVTGDAQLVARVATLQQGNSYAKAGLMFRESVAAGAAHVLLDVRPNGAIEFMSRATTGDVTSFLAGGTQSVPAWLKLTRTGSTFIAAASADGANWTTIGSVTAALASNTILGMAVTSHDTTTLESATFDNVAVTLPPTGIVTSAPADASNGIAIAAPLAWSATGAQTYDVKFGTTNPPALVASGVAAPSYQPAPLTNATTYFWQIVAHNAAGTSTSPVWSFTTIVSAPTSAVAASPATGATGVGITSPLTWSAASGATSYDVSFGVTNPPPTVATGLMTTTYMPAAMTKGTTYFWQVVARNAGGATASPLFSFTSIVPPPDAPAAPAPALGASSVATSASLAWSAAAGAASYDVNFGATTPPPAAAAALTGTAYTPAPMTTGTTYYWQVIAHNNGGATAGPIWSFTSIVAAPDAANAPAPADGSTAIAIATPLTWTQGAGSASQDVLFGTSNPPATLTAGVSSSSFAPPGVALNTTYYWQVIEHNAGGTTAGPVWSFTTVVPAPTPTGNVVLYATDATNLHGNWALVADATAAGGQAIASADRGASNTAGALASPVDYFEVPFTASAGTVYHVWFRMKAAANSKYNDSVFAQFSDALDANGASLDAIGSTNALVVNLANDSTGANLSGWGWQDGAYWLTQTSTIRFAATGSHTLRVQTREDGASIDQVVLSATTYLTAMPGSASGDSTIVSKSSSSGTPTTTSGGSTPGSPALYNAISDRNAYAKPALPTLGAAGFTFADPTFGSKMLRVTDGQTRPGSTNRSFRVSSNAHVSAWNASSTAFYVVSNDGTVIPYAFNPSTMTASRMQPANSGDGGLTLAFYVEPQFSAVNPNLIYGAVSGSNNRTISQYDFAAGTYATVLNLDTIVGGLANTYVGGILTGGSPSENLLTIFGGAAQDQHYYALWMPIANAGARKLINTVTSTINGAAVNITLNFHLHSSQIDKSGRFVFLYPTAVDLAAPRYAAQVYVWDTSDDTITAITSGGMDGAVAMHPAGHDASGYGTWVNQDCCTSTTWDAAEWQFRDLTSLYQTSDLINPPQAVKEIYMADHTTWNNARPDALVPVISSTYRYGNNTAPWRAWDDEIIGIDTRNGGGGLVWRFAHHRSIVGSDSDPTTPYFWYEPIANVSPDGKWVVFTSNWEKTLGTDSAEGTKRQDVFMVQLTPGS